jgi:DNA-binding LytR/AlgR family response regulator
MKLLIVDDEPLARSTLARLCEHSAGVDVVGEAGSGSAAISAAERLQPDVMLLDVRLPDMTGFDVLRAARRNGTPLGIMVGAQSEQPFRAFEAGVIDYLVKPIGVARFTESLVRARQRALASRAPATAAPALAQPLEAGFAREAGAAAPQILIGERERRFYVLKPDKVDYIESHGNYVKFHAGKTEYICRDSVKRLAGVLADSGFIRIERSLMLNTRAILYVQRMGRGTYSFTLLSGACLHSGAAFRDDILRVLPLSQVSGARSAH